MALSLHGILIHTAIAGKKQYIKIKNENTPARWRWHSGLDMAFVEFAKMYRGPSGAPGKMPEQNVRQNRPARARPPPRKRWRLSVPAGHVPEGCTGVPNCRGCSSASGQRVETGLITQTPGKRTKIFARMIARRKHASCPEVLGNDQVAVGSP